MQILHVILLLLAIVATSDATLILSAILRWLLRPSESPAPHYPPPNYQPEMFPPPPPPSYPGHYPQPGPPPPPHYPQPGPPPMHPMPPPGPPPMHPLPPPGPPPMHPLPPPGPPPMHPHPPMHPFPPSRPGSPIYPISQPKPGMTYPTTGTNSPYPPTFPKEVGFPKDENENSEYPPNPSENFPPVPENPEFPQGQDNSAFPPLQEQENYPFPPESGVPALDQRPLKNGQDPFPPQESFPPSLPTEPVPPSKTVGLIQESILTTVNEMTKHIGSEINRLYNLIMMNDNLAKRISDHNTYMSLEFHDSVKQMMDYIRENKINLVDYCYKVINVFEKMYDDVVNTIDTCLKDRLHVENNHLIESKQLSDQLLQQLNRIKSDVDNCLMYKQPIDNPVVCLKNIQLRATQWMNTELTLGFLKMQEHYRRILNMSQGINACKNVQNLDVYARYRQTAEHVNQCVYPHGRFNA